MNRREMLQLSLLSGGAVLLSAESNPAMADCVSTGGVPVPLSTGGVFDPPSPKTTAFLSKLPCMPTKTSLPSVDDLRLPVNGGVAPNGTVYPQITGKDATTTYRNSLERIVALHQRNSGSNIQFSPKKFYVLNVKQAEHVFSQDDKYKDGSIIWGYDGIYPGPTFMSKYGEPILVRIYNRLFDNKAANGFTPGRPTPGGFGDPRISTHLHNGHTGSESDGNPVDIYPPLTAIPGELEYPHSIRAIRFRDHHYPMFRAGLNPRATNKDDGDIAETVSTLWYHDHSMDHTAENVYKGLVGFHLFFDEIDSGDENDTNSKALRLPSGDFDIPLLFQDKRFDSNGQLCLDPLASNHDGFLGDKFVVNGQIQPKLTVLRRKYRFRLLNAGPSRFYQFFLTLKNVDQEFQHIGNDESLLEHPVKVNSVLLAVAERGDVVIDFSQFKKDDQLFLENRLVMQNDGTGPDWEDQDSGKFVKFKVLPAGTGDQILRFDVGEDVLTDPSHVPDDLRPNPRLPTWTEKSPGVLKSPSELKQLNNHKSFAFNKNSGEWLINLKSFHTSLSTLVRQNPLPGTENEPTTDPLEDRNSRPDGEVWTITNEAGSTWSHPIHIHLEEFRILWRTKNGAVPSIADPPAAAPAHEQSRKDVLRIDPNEEVQVFLRFRDFLGKYPIHCHNVIHEDMSMMRRFDVVNDL